MAYLIPGYLVIHEPYLGRLVVNLILDRYNTLFVINGYELMGRDVHGLIDRTVDIHSGPDLIYRSFKFWDRIGPKGY